MHIKIGATLRGLRENLSLSQSELATYLDLPLETIQGLETDQIPSNLGLLTRITQFFGTTLAGLITPDEQSLSLDLAFDCRSLGPLTPAQIEHLCAFRIIVNNYLRLDRLARVS